MSAKIISSLTEENRDLQKQIGCMNGIFQLFDRHYFVAGRRVTAGHNHKRLLQGANHNKESKAATVKPIEKNLDVAMKDKPRVSAESPRTSSSSFSCPSTLSSLDRDKTVQPGQPPSTQSNSFDSPTGKPQQQKNPTLHSSQQSVDLRDVIKDSMHREHRALSVKTLRKEEGRGHKMKHIDSPRPSQQLKSGQPRFAHLDASIRTIAEPQEAIRSSRREKDSPLRLAQKDLPRFSYDGRETRDAFKSMRKFKELPRLSLDSRESSLRSSISESRLNFLLRDLQRDNGNTTQMLHSTQEPGSNKRSSNVVVKLMGLEAFPDSNSRNEGEVTKLHSFPDGDFGMRTSEKASDRKTQPPAFSPQIIEKDPATLRLRNASLVMKPTSNSRFPLEPAPWRQPDASRDAPRTAPRDGSSCASATHPSSTVYGEIEKRISELEFRKSSKDLRALKQILEAMQKSRKSLEIQNQEEADLQSETSRSSLVHSRSNQVTTASNYQRNQGYPLAQNKGSNSPKRLNSSIIISKGARPTNSSSSVVITTDAPGLQKLRTQNTVDKLAANDLTPRNSALKDKSDDKSCTDKKNIGKTMRTGQTSRAPRLVKADNYAAFGRSSGSLSPRFQGKKQGIDKQSHTTNPSPDSSKARRKSSKSPIELDSSSTRNLKPQTILRRGNYKVSSNNDPRNFSHQVDTASQQSESNSSLASQIETEITSTESSIEINAKPQINPKERDFAARLSEDMAFAELATTATEQPSPVSVLDATFYREDSPSPVKKISTVFQDFGTPETDEAEWHLDNPDNLSDSTGPKIGDELNQKQLESIEYLVHKLRLLSTTHDDASLDKIATLCRSPKPDHKYITKLLLASGLIKGFGTFSTAIQLHSSGHLINPNLFHVLEQTEQHPELVNQENSRKVPPLKSDQKIHRKIIFDTVNEILVRKLASESTFMPKRTKTGQELLKELYSEIDRLQATADCSLEDDDDLATVLNVDMMQQPDEWADSKAEIPAVVLDIERLIFKDLITEVLTDEGVGVSDWPKRQCRKLLTEY